MSILTISTSDRIQQAFRSLNPRQKSVLKLLPGVYEEDLCLPSNVTLEGSGVADLDFTVIRGKHAFPTSGCIAFNHIKFESEGNTFESDPNADFTFLYRSCVIQINRGYPLNLPKAKGSGILFDCCVYGKDNGFINNKNGSINLRLYNMTSKSECPDSLSVLNGSSLFFNVHINHKIHLLGAHSKYDFQGGCWIEGEIIKEDNVKLSTGSSNLELIIKK